MSKYGIKIKNIKAGTLYGYNKGLRTRYDYTDAMLNNSLFSLYMSKNGMNVYKGETTRDIICLEFNFGSRSYDEEIKHLKEILESSSDNSKDKINKIIIVLILCFLTVFVISSPSVIFTISNGPDSINFSNPSLLLLPLATTLFTP